jgi:hypothetical protein
LKAGAEPTAVPESPAAWAADIRCRYELSTTESKLIDLAVHALSIAENDALDPGVRLSAMNQFHRLTKSLNLEVEDDGKAEEAKQTTVRPWPRAVERGHD